ncbi:MAG TPA: DUF11 domain-containing protein, partial [Anaerolineae bacterium]|nr:DUF11 domain-containing protein [Anaerolineae bacterium]
MSRKLWNSLIVLLILAGTMPVAADAPPTTGADVPLALMPAWAEPLRASAAGQPTGGIASTATHLWQPEAGPTPPAPEGEPGWEQPFPPPPPEEMEEPEQPADPRYIPVLPPDPERESQEQPPEEPEQGPPPKAPSAATASDCTAESDLDITDHTLSDPPAPGYEVEYQITVESQGNAAARDVRITDTLPMSVTYVSDTPPTGFTTAITTGGQVVWERQVPLNPSEIVIGSVRVRVNDTAVVGGILTNTVVVTTSDPDVNPADNHNTRSDTIVTPTRDLQVTKSLNGGTPIPGTQIEYLLQFENNGNYTAHDVVLTDTLPPSVTYVSWSGYMYNPGYYDLDANIVPTIANGQIVWPLGDILAGGHGYIYLTVRITDTAPPTGILTNTAVITTSDQEANPGDNIATRSDSVITPTRDLQVTKSLSLYSNEPITGAQVEYKLWVKNNGNATAHDVVLTDTLPPSVTYVSWYGHSYNPSYYDLDANIVPTITHGQIVWPLGNLVAGGRGYIYLTVQITDTAPVGGVLTNTIVVTTSDQETSPGDESDTLASTIVTPTRDVQIAKYLYNTALPGETIQYRLWLQNNGNATAHDVVLTDTLSPSATYVSWSGYGSGQVTPTVANGQIVWHLGDVPAGTSDSIYLTVQITDTAPVGGILTNTAVITTSDPDTNSTNNTTTRYDTIANPTRDLQVTKSLNSGTPLPGAQIEYQLYFKNNGNATAHDVVLTDTLPPNVTYVSWSGYGSGQITPTVANGQVVWQLGEVSGGQNDSIYLTVQIDDSASPGALLTNTAVITTSDPDTAPNNDADTLTTTVMTPTSDLLVSKSLYSWHTNPIAGNNIKYRLYFRNTGKTDAHDVLLTDPLPAEVSYVSWYGYMYNPSRYDLDANIVPTIVNGQIIWPLGDVGVGHFGYIFVTVHISDTASARDVLCNHAAISSPVEDSDPGNNVFTHTLTVYYPTVDLAVDKSLFGEPGAPGGNMEYRIILGNNGTAAAHNILLTDTLPPSVTLVSWAGGASTVTETADGKLIWPIGTLAAGGWKYIYVTIHLDDALNVGDLLTNTISVGSSDTDLDERDNADTVVTTVSPPTRDLLVSKGLDSDLVPGEQARYRVELSNQGNFTATGVILTDTLPASVTLASWTGLLYNPERLLPAPDIQDGQLVWHIGELKAGQYAHIYLYVLVDEGVAPGTALTNTAVVSLAETDANPDDNEAQYRAVAIAPVRDLFISKQEADLPALPGGGTTFHISFGNDG